MRSHSFPISLIWVTSKSKFLSVLFPMVSTRVRVASSSALRILTAPPVLVFSQFTFHLFLWFSSCSFSMCLASFDLHKPNLEKSLLPTASSFGPRMSAAPVANSTLTCLFCLVSSCTTLEWLLKTDIRLARRKARPKFFPDHCGRSHRTPLSAAKSVWPIPVLGRGLHPGRQKIVHSIQRNYFGKIQIFTKIL